MKLLEQNIVECDCIVKLLPGRSEQQKPGDRTAWHAHPLGQTLIVAAACGLAQTWWRAP